MFHEFALYVDRVRARRDRDITLAWHIAALTRGTKGLPKLETLLSKRRTEPQSVSQQRLALQMIFGDRKQKQLAAKKGTR